MNWFKGLDTSSIDTHVGNNIYGGLVTQQEGVDLRQEMNWILYGKSSPPVRSPKGHWVVYRRFDRNTKSDNYSKRTHEGIGGPAYDYSDELLRTRMVPVDKRGIPLEPTKAGIDIGDKYVYYFEYTVVPKRGDQIFEIDWNDHSITPTNISSLTFTDRYTIARTHPYRLENGNVQYYIVSVNFDEISY